MILSLLPGSTRLAKDTDGLNALLSSYQTQMSKITLAEWDTSSPLRDVEALRRLLDSMMEKTKEIDASIKCLHDNLENPSEKARESVSSN